MTLPATSALCRVFTFILAGSPIIYSPVPKGSCSNCCVIKERQDIKYMLYTRQNPIEPQYLYLNDEKRLYQSHFNFDYPLVIYLHGFSESATADKQSSQELKNAFLRNSNYNVILIDWSPLTTVPWYTNAVDNMSITGRYIARFVRFLHQQGFKLPRIHLIGFSLGAEVAGFIGKQLQEWNLKLYRITGLDPALPLFDGGTPHHKLGPHDAYFVDVVHTDGGILGNPAPKGHADFYPNGGHALQPGCARQEIANNRWLGILIGCSHQRSWEYFIETIRSPMAFPVQRCEPSPLIGRCQYDDFGNAYMGMGADMRLRGKFYLETKDEPPFGKNTPSYDHYRIQYNVTEPSKELPENIFFDIVTLMTRTTNNNNKHNDNKMKINNGDKGKEKQERQTIYHLQYPGWLPKEEEQLKILSENGFIRLSYKIDYENFKSKTKKDLRLEYTE